MSIASLVNCSWLRRRNGTWELKYAPGDSLNGESSGKVTKYLESQDEQEITQVVLRKLGSQFSGPLNELVINESLRPIADVSSRRRVYSLDGCTVTLDMAADLGDVCVGEVEVMVDASSDEDAVQRAIERVNALAEKLGR